MIDYPKPEQLTGEDADDYRDEHEGVDPPVSYTHLTLPTNREV